MTDPIAPLSAEELTELRRLAEAVKKTETICAADQLRSQGPGLIARHWAMLDARVAFERAFSPDVALALIARVHKAEAALSVERIAAILDRHWLRLELPLAVCTCGEWRMDATDSEALGSWDPDEPGILPPFSTHCAVALLAALKGDSE